MYVCHSWYDTQNIFSKSSFSSINSQNMNSIWHSEFFTKWTKLLFNTYPPLFPWSPGLLLTPPYLPSHCSKLFQILWLFQAFANFHTQPPFKGLLTCLIWANPPDSHRQGCTLEALTIITWTLCTGSPWDARKGSNIHHTTIKGSLLAKGLNCLHYQLNPLHYKHQCQVQYEMCSFNHFSMFTGWSLSKFIHPSVHNFVRSPCFHFNTPGIFIPHSSHGKNPFSAPTQDMLFCCRA